MGILAQGLHTACSSCYELRALHLLASMHATRQEHGEERQNWLKGGSLEL